MTGCTKMADFDFQDLEAVCKRFDHQLTSDSNHLADLVSIGSRIITCSTLGMYFQIVSHCEN